MDSSPFLFNPPAELPHEAFGYSGSTQGETQNGQMAGNSYSSSLASLTMPMWPSADSQDSYVGRSSESWDLSSVRPFTAPASAYYYSGYSQEEPVSIAPAHSFAPSVFSPAPAKPFPSSSGWPLSAGPTYIRPTSYASRFRQTSLPEQAQDVESQSGSPFLYAPPPVNQNGGVAYHQVPAFMHQRPATSGPALYGGLSVVSSSSAPSSRPSTSSRPGTAASSTSTVHDDDVETDEAPSPKKTGKRARRRFDEIERLYTCTFPGCTKGYGTLNHLNAHVTMQKHGPKRLPAEFKAVRKEWKEKKKLEEVARKRQPRRTAPVQSDDEGEEDAEQEQTPTPPAVTTPTNDSPASVRRSSIDSSFAYPPTERVVSPVHALSGQREEPVPHSAPMAFPQPIRPQTAPSAEALSYMVHPPSMDDFRSPVSLDHFYQKMQYRRTSLPNAQFLPTLHEQPEGHFGGEHQTVYS